MKSTTYYWVPTELICTIKLVVSLTKTVVMFRIEITSISVIALVPTVDLRGIEHNMICLIVKYFLIYLCGAVVFKTQIRLKFCYNNKSTMSIYTDFG